jgi:hypothetical protein
MDFYLLTPHARSFWISSKMNGCHLILKTSSASIDFQMDLCSHYASGGLKTLWFKVFLSHLNSIDQLTAAYVFFSAATIDRIVEEFLHSSIELPTVRTGDDILDALSFFAWDVTPTSGRRSMMTCCKILRLGKNVHILTQSSAPMG